MNIYTMSFMNREEDVYKRQEYMFRERALGSGAITEIFENIQNNFKDLTPEQLHDAEYAKRTLPFAGEIYMGPVSYTHLDVYKRQPSVSSCIQDHG